jgi:hypothetical protein
MKRLTVVVASITVDLAPKATVHVPVVAHLRQPRRRELLLLPIHNDSHDISCLALSTAQQQINVQSERVC